MRYKVMLKFHLASRGKNSKFEGKNIFFANISMLLGNF